MEELCVTDLGVLENIGQQGSTLLQGYILEQRGSEQIWEGKVWGGWMASMDTVLD